AAGTSSRPGPTGRPRSRRAASSSPRPAPRWAWTSPPTPPADHRPRPPGSLALEEGLLVAREERGVLVEQVRQRDARRVEDLLPRGLLHRPVPVVVGERGHQQPLVLTHRAAVQAVEREPHGPGREEIGRASCRESGWLAGDAVGRRRKADSRRRDQREAG